MIRRLLHRWGWLTDCEFYGHDDVELEGWYLRRIFDCQRCGRSYVEGGAMYC